MGKRGAPYGNKNAIGDHKDTGRRLWNRASGIALVGVPATVVGYYTAKKAFQTAKSKPAKLIGAYGGFIGGFSAAAMLTSPLANALKVRKDSKVHRAFQIKRKK